MTEKITKKDDNQKFTRDDARDILLEAHRKATKSMINNGEYGSFFLQQMSSILTEINKL